MKKEIAIAIALFMMLPLASIKGETTENSGNEIYDVAVDSHGNIIVTGSYSQGDSTIIKTQKYDSKGKLIWEEEFKKSNIKTNVGEAVAVDSNDNIYIGGIVGAGSISSDLSSLFTDYIILKYDKNGNLLWHKEYNNHFADLLSDIGIDEDGNVYATGITIEIDLQSQQLTDSNFWTIKVDPTTGEKIGEHEYDHGGTDAAFGMDVRNGNIVVVGGVDIEQNNTRFAIVKYDKDLNMQWEKFYGKNAAATDAVILQDGSIAVGGNKDTNFWLIFLDSNGNLKWDKTDGKAYTDYSLGIALDDNENIIMGCHVSQDGAQKWHVVKYRRSGKEEWSKTYDIEGVIKGVATYQNSIFAGGYKIVGGENKYCLVKFDEDGNKVWEGHSQETELKADFSYYPANPTRNTVVHFTDLSKGANKWHWDFGDGETSDERNPSHIYNQIGTFEVTLTVWKNASGEGKSDEITKEITIVNSPPTAAFSYNPANPVVNETISFDASSSTDEDGNIVNYTWQFGDGSTGYGKIVSHKYAKAGNYNVKLTVKDNDGSIDSIMKVITVNNITGNEPPIASFTYSPSQPSVGEKVKFNASMSNDDGTIILYKWDWNGDGVYDASYTKPIAEYSWDKAGKYNVTLQVVDNASLTNTYTLTIEVKEKGGGIILTGIEKINVKKGAAKTVKLTIKNGLPYDISSVEISVESADEGINASVLDKNISLKSGEKKEVRIKIVAQKGGEIRIKASGDGISTEYSMMIDVEKETPGFTFIALLVGMLAFVVWHRWKQIQ